MAQQIKNPPAVLETQVQSLCREDPLKQTMATHFSILAWEIPWDLRNLTGYSPCSHKESDMLDMIERQTLSATLSPGPQLARRALSVVKLLTGLRRLRDIPLTWLKPRECL